MHERLHHAVRVALCTVLYCRPEKHSNPDRKPAWFSSPTYSAPRGTQGSLVLGVLMAFASVRSNAAAMIMMHSGDTKTSYLVAVMTTFLPKNVALSSHVTCFSTKCSSSFEKNRLAIGMTLSRSSRRRAQQQKLCPSQNHHCRKTSW